MARVFPFILKKKHKIQHVKRAWTELEILQKKQSADFRLIDSNSRSIESNGLPTLQNEVLIHQFLVP